MAARMSAEWPFGDLRMFGYRVIYADPPWRYENYSKAGEWKNAARHYDCMSIDQIAALPVGHLAQERCALFLWATNPLLDRAIEVMKAWGFRYTTVAFTWAKRTRRDTDWHMGLGYSTRANAEICLLGTIGDVGLPRSRAVRSLIVEPVREHSRKPDRVPADIERMYGGPYVELFARTSRPGWESWGNETEKFEAA
jgi:N6-adenosine-specific RNA methylase IME4